MIRSVIFDVGETITRDDRYWAACADWLDIPRHTLSALVGAVVARGDDNSEALRLIRPGIDVPTEYAAREAAGRGEQLDDSDLYPDVRPALASLQSAGIRVVIAGNQTARAGQLLRGLDLPADVITTSDELGAAKPDPEFRRDHYFGRTRRRQARSRVLPPRARRSRRRPGHRPVRRRPPRQRRPSSAGGRAARRAPAPRPLGTPVGRHPRGCCRGLPHRQPPRPPRHRLRLTGRQTARTPLR